MQVNIMKPAMRSGLILGVLFSLNFLVSISGNTFLAVLSYFVLAFILVATYRLTIQFRDNDCEGYVSYSRAFVFILLSFFYAALISALVKFIYLQFINPNYLREVYDLMMLYVEKLNMPIEDEFETTLSDLLKPASFALQSIWVNMISGVFVGLIMSAFVKKEKSIFDE